jgi:hypothetical protein
LLKFEITPFASEPLDRFQQVRGPSVVQEEDALTQAPQRRAAEFPWSGLALADAVGEPDAHVVHQQIGVEICRLTAERRHLALGVRHERRRMA